MLKKHHEIIIFILFLSDILIIASSFFLAYFLRRDYFPLHKGNIIAEHNVKLMFFFVMMWMIVFVVTKMYRPKRGFSFLIELKKIIYSSICAFAFTFCLIFFIGIDNTHISRLFLILFLFLSTFFLSLYRFFFRVALKILRKKGLNLRHIIIIGNRELSTKIVDKITQELWTGYKIIGYIDDKIINNNEKNQKNISDFYRDKNIKCLGDIKNIEKIIDQYQPDSIFIPFYLTKGSLFIRTIYTLSIKHGVTIRIVPDIYSFDIFMNFRMEFVDDLPVITLKDHPMYGFNGISKRIFDIVFSISILVCFSPLFLLIALLIKCSSRGPVFYWQERVNINQNIFKIIKFRTMPVGIEKSTGPKWASKGENRATFIGGFLRKTSLDELPQFINVLKGEMSVVGPRPERPDFIKQFRKDISNYMSRHQMKAGITGWAQINGWRGNTSLDKRLEYDIYYINNWSIGFDAKIVTLTFFKGFF